MSASVAWITGGGTGIGRALAEQLSQQGWSVLISGRRKDVLTQTAAEIGAKGGGSVLALAGDVSDAAYVQQAIETIRQRWGDVDLLVNNAGVNTYRTFQEAEPKEFADIFAVNCLAAILCTKAVLPAMRIRRKGVIVNVSSILGKWASGKSSSYSISKYALAGFTDSLRQELDGTGVHVIGVYPGFIRTSMTTTQLSKNSWKAHLGASPESMARAILRGVRSRKREVLYPFYVSWILRAHRWLPGLVEAVRRNLKD